MPPRLIRATWRTVWPVSATSGARGVSGLASQVAAQMSAAPCPGFGAVAAVAGDARIADRASAAVTTVQGRRRLAPPGARNRPNAILLLEIHLMTPPRSVLNGTAGHPPGRNQCSEAGEAGKPTFGGRGAAGASRR